MYVCTCTKEKIKASTPARPVLPGEDTADRPENSHGLQTSINVSPRPATFLGRGREAARHLFPDGSLREERVTFELPAPPHLAQGDPALEIMTGIDLALTALDVFGID